MHQKIALFFTFLVAAIYTLLIIFQSEIADTTDGISHFFYAKYLFQYPDFAFHHWAKPVFTLLAAGPAQFGAKGIMVLNAIFMGWSAWLAFVNARFLKLHWTPLAPLFLGLGNGVIYVILGGLTEPTFILFSSGVLFLALRQKFGWANLLAGATLLIRPEAVVFIPVLVLWNLSERKIVSLIHFLWIPFAFSIAGYLISDLDLLWVFKSQPYSVKSVYGQGDWLHYYDKWHKVASPIILYLSIFGGAWLLYRWKKWKSLWPIAMIGFGIIFLHVVLWKFGLMGAAGLPRTLTTSLPALVLMAVFGLEALPLRHVRNWSMLFALLFVYQFNKHRKFPGSLDPKFETAQMLVDKIKPHYQPEKMLFYQYSATPYLLGHNPIDEAYSKRLWSLNQQAPSAGLQKDDLLIWDNITGHREGKANLEVWHADKNLTPIDSVVREKWQIKMVAFKVK